MTTIAVPKTELHLVTLTGLKLEGQAPLVVTDTLEEPLDTPIVITRAAPSAEITHNRQVGGDELDLTGIAPSSEIIHARSTPAGSALLTGLSPSAEVVHSRSTDAGSVELNGLAPTVSVGASALVEPGSGSLALTEQTPVRGFGLQLTGLAPLAVEETEQTVPKGELALTGAAPSVLHRSVVGVGSLTLVGAAPDLVESDVVSPGVGSLTFSSVRPEIGGTVSIEVSVGSIEISGVLPAIEIANAGTAVVNPNATQGPSHYEQCDYTGFRVLPGELVETGYGKWVRPKSFEPKHPQDFTKSVKERRREGPQRPEQDEEFVDTVTAEDL